MVVSKTEHAVICNTARWREFLSRVAMRGRHRISLCGLVIALIAHGDILAQPSSIGKWGDAEYKWSAPEIEDPARPHIADEPNVFFDRVYTVGQRGAISSIVTLHELGHRVPGRATKEYERALKAKKRGDNEKAIAYFKNAIAVDPEFCAAINDLGATYLRLDMPGLAAEQFQQAIAVDSHAGAPYSNLAVAYLMQNAYADAERAARRAIDLNRGSTHGLLVLGVSLVLDGKFTAEAERSLTRAAADFATAKLWHAIWLAGTGEIANARDKLRTYVAHREPGVEFATAILQHLE
jgi:tetratricopeptide (TPR) repeat protein